MHHFNNDLPRITGLILLLSILTNQTFAQTESPKIDSETTSKSGFTDGFALVELFTSEGCSSCPSADQNLIAITKEAASKNLPVYTLSFHVDYWNQLGWKDPFSSKEITDRQRSYSRAFGSNRIYTPQMVINGSKEFVGSDQEKSLATINSVLRLKPKSNLQLKAEIRENKIHIFPGVQGFQKGDVINIALVQNEAKRKVTSGENSNRTLTHSNVVREFRTLEASHSENILTLPRPENFSPNEFHVVAYLQSPSNAVIHAASRAKITAR